MAHSSWTKDGQCSDRGTNVMEDILCFISYGSYDGIGKGKKKRKKGGFCWDSCKYVFSLRYCHTGIADVQWVVVSQGWNINIYFVISLPTWQILKLKCKHTSVSSFKKKKKKRLMPSSNISGLFCLFFFITLRVTYQVWNRVLGHEY